MMDDREEHRDSDSPRGNDAVDPMSDPAPPTKSGSPAKAARAGGSAGFPNAPSESFRREVDARRGQLDDVDSEQHLWQGGYSSRAMVGTWLLCLILSIAAIVATIMIEALPWVATLIAIALLWVIVVGVYAVRRMGVHYELTTQRVIHQSGILSRRTDRIEVIDIDDVSYEQGLVQRMFGIGTIRIDSSDRSHPVLTMKGIANVHEVAGLFDDTRRKERRRRSLHIESI